MSRETSEEKEIRLPSDMRERNVLVIFFAPKNEPTAFPDPISATGSGSPSLLTLAARPEHTGTNGSPSRNLDEPPTQCLDSRDLSGSGQRQHSLARDRIAAASFRCGDRNPERQSHPASVEPR